MGGQGLHTHAHFCLCVTIYLFSLLIFFGGSLCTWPWVWYGKALKAWMLRTRTRHAIYVLTNAETSPRLSGQLSNLVSPSMTVEPVYCRSLETGAKDINGIMHLKRGV